MQDKEKHIRIVSNILIGLGIFYLLAVVFAAGIGLWATKNYVQADNTDVALLPAALTAAALLIPLALFAIMHIVTGRAFKTQASWARIALWILAILNLGNVPLGTAFGAYAIWILVNTREDIAAIP